MKSQNLLKIENFIYFVLIIFSSHNCEIRYLAILRMLEEIFLKQWQVHLTASTYKLETQIIAPHILLWAINVTAFDVD